MANNVIMPSAHIVRTISVRAYADPRTVMRFLRGESVRALSAARIKDTIDKMRTEGAMKDPDPCADEATHAA